MKFEKIRNCVIGFRALVAISLLFCPSITAAETIAGKEWAQSGFGNSKKFRCKAESCGGSDSVVSSLRFGGVSGAPGIGIPEGSNMEAEFRRRPEVRRTLAAALKQYMKENGSTGTTISTTYFSNGEFVGFVFTGFDPKYQLHVYGEMRVNDSRVLLVGSESKSKGMVRRNFNAISPLIK